ncbi:hypothetical protein D3C85_1325960 [compost metagenome]
MQSIVVAGTIAQHQRGRPRLARRLALGRQLTETVRKAWPIQPRRPAVGEGRQAFIKPRPQPRQGIGQGIVEILILALPEAVALHDDPTAKPLGLVIKGFQGAAGGGRQQRPGYGPALEVQIIGDAGPVEGVGHGRHRRRSRRPVWRLSALLSSPFHGEVARTRSVRDGGGGGTVVCGCKG